MIEVKIGGVTERYQNEAYDLFIRAEDSKAEYIEVQIGSSLRRA